MPKLKPNPDRWTPGRRGRPPAASLDSKIRLLIDENPKKPGTAAFQNFTLYRDGMTVREFINIPGAPVKHRLQRLRFDLADGWLELE